MGMGISQKLGNGGGREWELNRWEREGMGMLKAIPAHLYSESETTVITPQRIRSPIEHGILGHQNVAFDCVDRVAL